MSSSSTLSSPSLPDADTAVAVLVHLAEVLDAVHHIRTINAEQRVIACVTSGLVAVTSAISRSVLVSAAPPCTRRRTPGCADALISASCYYCFAFLISWFLFFPVTGLCTLGTWLFGCHRISLLGDAAVAVVDGRVVQVVRRAVTSSHICSCCY